MHSTPAAEGKARPQCFPRPFCFLGTFYSHCNQRKRSFKLYRVLQHAFHLGTIPGGAQRKQNRVGFLHSQQERGQEDVVVLPRHLSNSYRLCGQQSTCSRLKPTQNKNQDGNKTPPCALRSPCTRRHAEGLRHHSKDVANLSRRRTRRHSAKQPCSMIARAPHDTSTAPCAPGAAPCYC